MFKKFFPFSLVIISGSLFATDSLNLYQAPLNRLKNFSFIQNKTSARSTLASNTLQKVNQTSQDSKTIVRYQQLYHGLAIIGAQITVTADTNQKQLLTSKSQANGHLIENIKLNTQPMLTNQQAVDLAKKYWSDLNMKKAVHHEQATLQIRADKNNELKLVYQVSFKAEKINGKATRPFTILDANTGEIMKQWDDIKNFSDEGPGGNEKVGKYWYGRDGLPSLEVSQNGEICQMESPQVKLIHLYAKEDDENLIVTPFSYKCHNNVGDEINGGFSPANDAYYFGHIIVNTYKDWYGMDALQNPDGTPMQLSMKVHLGERNDNAFWDGYNQTMNFGDGGSDFYPWVALDIAGHEVTHGFTQQHADLEYHDQSGSLNESFSDIGGQVAQAYLLEKSPQLFNKINIKPNEVSWGIGGTILKTLTGEALRYMDFPSLGSSADCLDKELARSHGENCVINYDDVVNRANDISPFPEDQQSYIVHRASGIFNKAFYLLSQNMGIKKAYHVMLIANSKYWTPSTDLIQGACGVLYGAKDLSVDISSVKTIFGQVGIDTKNCAI